MSLRHGHVGHPGGGDFVPYILPHQTHTQPVLCGTHKTRGLSLSAPWSSSFMGELGTPLFGEALHPPFFEGHGPNFPRGALSPAGHNSSLPFHWLHFSGFRLPSTLPSSGQHQIASPVDSFNNHLTTNAGLLSPLFSRKLNVPTILVHGSKQ
jgi:hypothetical protein